MARILAADIGGTNSRFIVFEHVGGSVSVASEEVRLSSAEAVSFEDIVGQVVARGGPFASEAVDLLVLAVAGPIEPGQPARLTRVPLVVDAAGLVERFFFKRVELVNDFIAQAYACLSPVVEGADVIQLGQAVPGAALAVIGAGTGLGHCAMIPDVRGRYVAAPSEAGHAVFPFARGERDLQDFIIERTGQAQPDVETLVSGSGLSLIHLFVTGRELEPADVAAELTPDSGTAEIFARFYGRACRNYVLATLAQGGLFVSGGVAIKNPFLADHQAFKAEFTANPAFAPLLSRVPVRLVRTRMFGLWGAAMYGATLD